MDAGGPRHLRDAGDGAFDIGRRGLHEIGQFVNDDDNEREPFGNDQFLTLLRRRDLEHDVLDTLVLRIIVRWRRLGRHILVGLFFQRSRIEPVDVAQAALREDAVTTLHFVDDVA